MAFNGDIVTANFYHPPAISLEIIEILSLWCFQFFLFISSSSNFVKLFRVIPRVSIIMGKSSPSYFTIKLNPIDFKLLSNFLLFGWKFSAKKVLMKNNRHLCRHAIRFSLLLAVSDFIYIYIYIYITNLNNCVFLLSRIIIFLEKINS